MLGYSRKFPTFAIESEAIHNKDYSVVKTFMAARKSRHFLFVATIQGILQLRELELGDDQVLLGDVVLMEEHYVVDREVGDAVFAANFR